MSTIRELDGHRDVIFKEINILVGRNISVENLLERTKLLILVYFAEILRWAFGEFLRREK